jgi:hypothetical protein
MGLWWGKVVGVAEAGTSQGQHLLVYEPRVGGRVEMEVNAAVERLRYGGRVLRFVAGRDLTFESDWIPNSGWGMTQLDALKAVVEVEGAGNA